LDKSIIGLLTGRLVCRELGKKLLLDVRLFRNWSKEFEMDFLALLKTLVPPTPKYWFKNSDLE